MLTWIAEFYKKIAKTMNMLKSNTIYVNERWNAISWQTVEGSIFKWQTAIYKASQRGEIKKVRLLQRRLTRSYYAKLLAVRRVTQDNRGCCKATFGTLSPQERLKLAKQLNIPTKPQPVRRLRSNIPKPGKTEKRPLGIPTIMDRCVQALLKLAIEPEWEAKFEPNSYGFRPGRNCHDAIAALRFACQTKKAKYVLDADIAKCFDRINHQRLLDKLGYKGRFRQQIQWWLEAGAVDENVFVNSEAGGTPQGGVISPLLANIALHGLESYLKDQIEKMDLKHTSPKSWLRSNSMDRRAKRNSLAVIRYADDFVVLHEFREVVIECRRLASEFLKSIGLELNPSKTRLTHTLRLSSEDNETLGFDGKVGFDFLGFTVKQFKSKYEDACSTTGEHLGYKTLIYPQVEKCQEHQKQLHEIILGKRGPRLSQYSLITKLNPVISGWARYMGTSDANSAGVLKTMEHLTYQKLRRWSLRKGPKVRLMDHHWKKLGSRRWVFSATEAGVTVELVQHSDYSQPLSKYIKVKALLRNL
jgi:RNA-directed DNA polymerase